MNSIALPRGAEAIEPKSQFGTMTTGVGIRGIAYLATSVAMALWVFVGTGSIAMGWLAPSPADDYAGITAFLVFWVALFAFVDNPGEKRTRIQRYEEFVYVWLVSSGLAQLFWELPFALMKSRFMYQLGAELRPDQWWLWPWWMYSNGDTRFQTMHHGTYALETMIALTGPPQLFAAYCIKKKQKYKTAMIIAALSHWGIMWMNTGIQYIEEIYSGLVHIKDGRAGFWIKWIGLNLHWSLLSPLCSFLALYLLMKKCEEEAIHRHLALEAAKTPTP
ncbi:MAG: hypothetical protein U0271_02915 [Polyangiaceae bacterium]